MRPESGGSIRWSRACKKGPGQELKEKLKSREEARNKKRRRRQRQTWYPGDNKEEKKKAGVDHRRGDDGKGR